MTAALARLGCGEREAWTAEPGAMAPILDRDGEDDEGMTVDSPISSYPGSTTTTDLVRGIERDEILIPKSLRTLRWPRRKASRFLESLILGLPTPPVFLYAEPGRERRLVADGRQRLLAIHSFYRGKIGDDDFRLSGVIGDLEGRSYPNLSYPHQQALDDAWLSTTVFHQRPEDSDLHAVYSLTERLGGAAPQEIRASLYHGPLSDLLGGLAENPHWRRLFRAPRDRKQDEEIILRFLALHNDLDACRRPLKRFLNGFMERNRDWNAAKDAPFASQFRDTVRAVAEHIGPDAFRPQGVLDAAVADAVLCGVAYRLETGAASDAPSLAAAHSRLIERLTERLPAADSGAGAANTDRVEERIAWARKVFTAG